MKLNERHSYSPSSGPMKSWKSSGQLTTTTSPMLAACQQVRLSHIHGHTEEETEETETQRGQCEAPIGISNKDVEMILTLIELN